MRKGAMLVCIILVLFAPVEVASAAKLKYRHFIARLTANQVVNAQGDRNARAEVRLDFNNDGTKLNYSVSIKDSSSDLVVISHIHSAPKGKNGPVLVYLLNGLWQCPCNGSYKSTLTSADLTDLILAGHPISDLAAIMATGDTYTDLHSTNFERDENGFGGKLRGQIRLNREKEDDDDGDGDRIIGFSVSQLQVYTRRHRKSVLLQK